MASSHNHATAGRQAEITVLCIAKGSKGVRVNRRDLGGTAAATFEPLPAPRRGGVVAPDIQPSSISLIASFPWAAPVVRCGSPASRRRHATLLALRQLSEQACTGGRWNWSRTLRSALRATTQWPWHGVPRSMSRAANDRTLARNSQLILRARSLEIWRSK